MTYKQTKITQKSEIDHWKRFFQNFVSTYDPVPDTPADVQIKVDNFYRKQNETVTNLMVRPTSLCIAHDNYTQKMRENIMSKTE